MLPCLINKQPSAEETDKPTDTLTVSSVVSWRVDNGARIFLLVA